MKKEFILKIVLICILVSKSAEGLKCHFKCTSEGCDTAFQCEDGDTCFMATNKKNEAIRNCGYKTFCEKDDSAHSPPKKEKKKVWTDKGFTVFTCCDGDGCNNKLPSGAVGMKSNLLFMIPFLAFIHFYMF